MFKKILFPTDGSDHASKALALAIDLTDKYDAELVILHVPHATGNLSTLRHFAEVEGLAHGIDFEIDRLKSVDYRGLPTNDNAFHEAAISPRLLLEIGEFILEGARQEAAAAGLEKVQTHIEIGDPAERILGCIESDDIDCVVMGSRGLTDLKGLFLGSVSHKVTNRAPCTCISVK